MSLFKPSRPTPPPAIRPEEAWLELAMRAADMGASFWDLEHDQLYLSDRAAAILGAPSGMMGARQGETLFNFTHPDDVEWVRRTILEAAKTGEAYKIEHRSFRVDDGQMIWLLSAGSPVRDDGGKVTRVLGVIQDITDRKAADARREMLLAELDHRVKNVLASVQSMALQSARRAPSLDAFLKTLSGRLKAMASAHTLLTATRWRGAEVRHIVNAELGGIAPGQTRWDGPDVAMTPKATNALALALHELATNALKFGALSTSAGRVDVRWSRNGAGGIDLEWMESGGPAVTPPAREGFGTVLLQNVTGQELGGEVRIEFRPVGVWAKLSSNAAALVTGAPASEAVETRQGGETDRPAPPAPARVPVKGLAGLKVLVVEDSMLLALELKNGLTEAGAVIAGQAASVEEAMALVGPGIEAGVLDVDLNGRSVEPVAQALARLGVPFVFATGYGDNGLAPQGFDAPIIRKPYDVTQVAAALADVTGRN